MYNYIVLKINNSYIEFLNYSVSVCKIAHIKNNWVLVILRLFDQSEG